MYSLNLFCEEMCDSLLCPSTNAVHYGIIILLPIHINFLLLHVDLSIHFGYGSAKSLVGLLWYFIELRQ